MTKGMFDLTDTKDMFEGMPKLKTLYIYTVGDNYEYA